MKIEIEIPKDYEKFFKNLTLKRVFKKSLEESLSELDKKLLINLLKEISSKQTKISLEDFPKGKLNKRALKAISEKIKEGIARRHGLV